MAVLDREAPPAAGLFLPEPGLSAAVGAAGCLSGWFLWFLIGLIWLIGLTWLI